MALLERAAGNGIQPIVSVTGPGMFTDRLESLGHQVVHQTYVGRLNRYGGAIYRDGWRSRIATLRDGGKYVIKCRRQLQEIQPAAVFCNDMRGLLTVGLAARLLRIPVIIWDKLNKPHGILDWFQLPIANCNAIISTPVACKYPRWQRWLYRNRIHVISDGVEFSRFQNPSRASSIREELGIADHELVVGIVGTVTPRKGHDILLAAFRTVRNSFPDCHLLIVGSWEDSQRDRDFYATLRGQGSEKTHFVGPREDIVEIMNSISILAIPSRHEGLGLVILEAMACGKPVVGSRVGGIPEVIVDHETGYLFAVDNEDELADCLLRLLSSESLRRQLGAAGRQRVLDCFDRESKMESICELIKACVR